MRKDSSDDSGEQEINISHEHSQECDEGREDGPNINMRELNLTMEETNLTMNHSQKISLALMDGFFTDHLQVFCPKLEVDRSKLMEPFSNYVKDVKEYECQEIMKSSMELYFTARKVLIKESKSHPDADHPRRIKSRHALLKKLYNYLYEKYPACGLEHHYDHKRPERDRCFLFIPNLKQPFFHYNIKYLRPDDNPEHDSDYLVEKLFDLYLKVCPQLRTISSFLLYWGFKRQILSPKYINESAFKVLILAFLVSGIENVTNVIYQYRDDYKGELDGIRKCLKIGKGGDWVVDPIIKVYEGKYIIEHAKGFTLEDGSCLTHPKVYTIDFPMQANEVAKMKQKFDEMSGQSDSKSSGRWIYMFFRFMEKQFKSTAVLRVNIAVPSGGQIFSVKPAPLQTLEIIHPVYGYNLTQNLRSDKQMKAVRDQFLRAFEVIREDDQQKIKKKLCSEYKQ